MRGRRVSRTSVMIALAFATGAALVRCGGGYLDFPPDGGLPDGDLDLPDGDRSCALVECPPGLECAGGQCVYADPCADVVCGAPGEVCSHGACVSGGLDSDGDGYPAIDDCDDADPEIFPGQTLECSSACGEGVMTCHAGATWSACTAPTDCSCTAGETLESECGRCGTAVAQCVESTWGPPGECTDQGECSPGASEVRSCGACSRESHTCGDTCVWGAWGGCESTGDCEPGDPAQSCTTSCGTSGTRTCSSDCFWNACQATPETGSACFDGTDNDCDGRADCSDSGCAGAGTEGCGSCSDGRDNDCDGRIDCDDSGCASCGSECGTPEADAATCHDGRDNDGDGLTDCADSGCARQGTVEICSNGVCGDGVDNDCADGTDCADVGCFGCCPSCPATENDQWACHDGRDNDCDGAIDCDDSSCDWTGTIESCGNGNCADGVDNDCVMGTDCADAGCTGCCPNCPAPENTPSACHDGRDNDCDGATDCADSECWNQGTLEVCSNGVCGDGIDNDCRDGTDCADVGCYGCCPSCPTGAENTPSACHDWRDNDCDGATDCADSECWNQGTLEICSNGVCGDGIDNDCRDGTDCADIGCSSCCS